MSKKNETKKCKSVKKKCKPFYCKFCDYYTSHKHHYDKHLATKNTKKVFPFRFQMSRNVTKKSVNLFSCDFCDKKYKTRNGLWKHVKKCEKKHPSLVSKSSKV